MKSLLLRTGSINFHAPTTPGGGSPKLSLSRRDSLTRSTVNSAKISLHMEMNDRRSKREAPIRRASSESNIINIRSERENNMLSGAGSVSFRARILEEEEEEEWLSLSNNSGGGGGDERKKGGEVTKIGEYYKEMIKSHPGDALLLRNYGKYLDEVEGDMEKAEEYYGRAILESPGDGEVLCLYGKLIWDKDKDGERAIYYFDQALSAAPDDCMVMGSYARFMWEAEEDEDDEMDNQVLPLPAIAMAVAAI